VYGKPGCHLCEEARSLLEALRERYPMVITEIDITKDPQLFRRYDIRIPVIVVDGKTELEAPITERNVRRTLGILRL